MVWDYLNNARFLVLPTLRKNKIENPLYFMNQQYQHIATLSCLHRYFKNGYFRPIRFSITDDSVKLMNDLGIILKSFSGGFHLLTSSLELLKSQNFDASIQIQFECSDSYYINYTNLSEYAPATDVVYITNLNKDWSPAGNNTINVHDETFVGNKDLAKVSTGYFEIPAFDTTKVYEFRDSNNNTLPANSILESPVDSGKFYIQELPEGLIQVLSGGEVVHRIYYNPNRVWKKPLGIIALSTATLYDQFNEIGLVAYRVQFNTRYTIWKYFLVGKSYEKYTPSILDNNKLPAFNELPKQEISATSEALVFESKEELPLLEYPENTFQLVDKYDPITKNSTSLIASLLSPSPEQLHSITLPTKKKLFYSHIYI